MKNAPHQMAPLGPTGQHLDAAPKSRFIAAASVAVYVPATPAAEVGFISEVRSLLLPLEAYRQMAALAASLALAPAELAVVLAIPSRSFARHLSAAARQESADFPPVTKVQTERLHLLRLVAAHGLAVFEAQGKFNRWLRRPLAMLQNQSPLQLLDTATGFRLIDQVLGRIEHGVYS